MVFLGCGSVTVLTHGGAGGWSRERANEALKVVEAAAMRGREVFSEARDPLDAVAAAVVVLEDSGVLNAGLGSVVTLEGSVQMDAGLMSSCGVVGAVAAVERIRNPILAALIVARETPHVLMAGRGAERLAAAFGLPPHPGPRPERVAQLSSRALRDRAGLLARLWGAKTGMAYCDTVGAVASTPEGLAAATSTGGVSYKLEGRVGDSPIPGAGFYADRLVACSATGIGEVILVEGVCRRLAEALKTGKSLCQAMLELLEWYTARHPEAPLGVIAVDSGGCGCAGVASGASMPVGFVVDEARGSMLLGCGR